MVCGLRRYSYALHTQMGSTFTALTVLAPIGSSEKAANFPPHRTPAVETSADFHGSGLSSSQRHDIVQSLRLHETMQEVPNLLSLALTGVLGARWRTISRNWRICRVWSPLLCTWGCRLAWASGAPNPKHLLGPQACVTCLGVAGSCESRLEPSLRLRVLYVLRSPIHLEGMPCESDGHDHDLPGAKKPAAALAAAVEGVCAGCAFLWRPEHVAGWQPFDRGIMPKKACCLTRPRPDCRRATDDELVVRPRQVLGLRNLRRLCTQADLAVPRRVDSANVHSTRLSCSANCSPSCSATTEVGETSFVFPKLMGRSGTTSHTRKALQLLPSEI